MQVTQASDWSSIGQRMAAAGMSTPVIVKPSVACGVSEAHAMTIVLRPAGFDEISCALPACVQEYVDHAAALYKVYVISSEVRWSSLLIINRAAPLPDDRPTYCHDEHRCTLSKSSRCRIWGPCQAARWTTCQQLCLSTALPARCRTSCRRALLLYWCV